MHKICTNMEHQCPEEYTQAQIQPNFNNKPSLN